MKITVFAIFLLVFSCFLPAETFAQYSQLIEQSRKFSVISAVCDEIEKPAESIATPQLIGREVVMRGPYSWEKLGVALSEKTGDDLIYAYRRNDENAFTAMLASYEVLRVTKGTKVLVLDAEILRGRARVIITTGFYKGMSGWIPIEWLKGNDHRYLFKEGVEKYEPEF